MPLYAELVDLKYRQGIATCELFRKFPAQTKRVSEVALLHIPENTLKKVVREKELLRRLINLKQKFPEIAENIRI